ncbi:MAG: class I SAM-dependent rRNA methyltransferase [Pyrinomonadaceae bacterium]|nr:class I SAM-dependent rRNA methyltransferase [Pyrinomonadaceae bacterium]
MNAEITINRRGAERARAGHLWIYRSDVRDTNDARGGQIVSVRDERKAFVGKALYSDRSEITLRLLTQRNEAIDRSWWKRRLHEAITRRVGIEQDADAFRLIYSEGDLLPALIVDKYRDVLVVQTLAQGTENLKEMFVELLVEEFAPRAVVERNDVRVRELEGLEMKAGVLYGEPPDELEVVQHGIRFRISPLGGQKTGAFLDQRENHAAARRFARGRALDCFTFNGGFALSMAKTCESVVGLDVSKEAVAAAERNARLNDLSNIEFRETNVFDALREMEAAGERFDTIVLDPPAFAKNRGSIKAALRGYKEINLRALKLLNAGGVLLTCTCSYHVSEGMFLDCLAAAASDARRRVQIVERRAQSQDHPILVGVPETYYLKCVVARVIE